MYQIGQGLQIPKLEFPVKRMKMFDPQDVTYNLGSGLAVAGMNTMQQAIQTNNAALQQLAGIMQQQQKQLHNMGQPFMEVASFVPPLQIPNSVDTSHLVNKLNSEADFSFLAKYNLATLSPMNPQQKTSRPQKKRKICQHPNGCTRFSRGSSGLCIRHGGEKADSRSMCAYPGGCNKGAQGPTNLCKIHGGGQRCQFPDCTKSSQGPSKFCIRHGGGRRCLVDGCSKSAQGKTQKCKAHGGGKRCQFALCPKSAQGATNFCKAHGGGKRCIQMDCTKAARGKTNFCVAHGGGKRCQKIGCTKSAVRPQYVFCTAHGGGKRCSYKDCSKGARYGTEHCRHHGTLLKKNTIESV